MQTVTLSIPNLTPTQANQVLTMVATMGAKKERKTKDVETDEDDAPLARLAGGKKKKIKTAPEKTVSEDEDEDFGREELEEEDLELSDDEDTDEEDEPGLEFSEVRDAINKYGERFPDQMKAIMTSFNIKNTKELERTPKKWEPVYRKVKAKLAAIKKKK